VVLQQQQTQMLEVALTLAHLDLVLLVVAEADLPQQEILVVLEAVEMVLVTLVVLGLQDKVI
jgi:hypothetical protein